MLETVLIRAGRAQSNTPLSPSFKFSPWAPGLRRGGTDTGIMALTRPVHIGVDHDAFDREF